MKHRIQLTEQDIVRMVKRAVNEVKLQESLDRRIKKSIHESLESNLKFEIKLTTWIEGSDEEPQESILGVAYDNVNAESIFNESVQDCLEEMGYNDGANVSFDTDDESQTATIIDLDSGYHCVYSINVSAN